MRSYYEKITRIEKLSRKEKLDLFFDLINAFNIVRNSLETAVFLQDLLTAGEIRNLSVRLRIAKLLLTGKTYTEIKEQVHASNTTITKVSLWLAQGGEGFKKVISKLPRKYSYPKKIPRGPLEYHLPELLLAISQHTAALSQDNKIKSFVKTMEEKKAIDAGLREKLNEYYRSQKKAR